MGCGQSNEQDNMHNGKETDSNSKLSSRASRGSKSKGTKISSPSDARGSVASPHPTSISPQNGSVAHSSAAQLSSVGSFGGITPGITMPTYTITDSTGHKVTSSIGSRNKVEVVTKWVDSVVRHGHNLPESRWRNPQEEAGREKVSLRKQDSSSLASSASESKSQYVPGSPSGETRDSSATTSQAVERNSLSIQPSNTSNVPNCGTSMQNPDILAMSPVNPGPISPFYSNSPGGGKTPPPMTKYEIDPGTEQQEETTAPVKPQLERAVTTEKTTVNDTNGAGAAKDAEQPKRTGQSLSPAKSAGARTNAPGGLSPSPNPPPLNFITTQEGGE